MSSKKPDNESTTTPESYEKQLSTVWTWPGILVYFAVGVPLRAFMPRHWDSIVAEAVATGALILWWALTFGRRAPSVAASLGPGLDGRACKLLLAAGAGCFLFVVCTKLLLLYFGGVTLSRGPMEHEAYSGPKELWPVAASLISGCVLTPIAEELIFRGALFRKWRTRIGPVKAAVFSSLLFGLPHGSPIGSTLFGLLMVLLYVRLGTLWAPIAAHCLNNAMSLAPQMAGPPPRPSWLGDDAITVGVTLGALTGLALVVNLFRGSWSQLGAPLPPDSTAPSAPARLGPTTRLTSAEG